MSSKEILFILLLVFTAGYISSQVVDTNLPVSGIAFLAMVGGLLGVIFNRMKHIDDLNLTRKKDTSLEYIKCMSEYRSAIINIIDPATSEEEFHKELMTATKNMVASLDKLHVVINDQISKELEAKNFQITCLMMKVRQQSTLVAGNKDMLLKWFVTEDIGPQLNIIRLEIINLINSEIGDGSGTAMLKTAIHSNNDNFKELFSKLLSK